MPFNNTEVCVALREYTRSYFHEELALFDAVRIVQPKITHIGSKRTLLVGVGAWGCVERDDDGFFVAISFSSNSHLDTKQLELLGFEEE